MTIDTTEAHSVRDTARKQKMRGWGTGAAIDAAGEEQRET